MPLSSSFTRMAKPRSKSVGVEGNGHGVLISLAQTRHLEITAPPFKSCPTVRTVPYTAVRQARLTWRCSPMRDADRWDRRKRNAYPPRAKRGAGDAFDAFWWRVGIASDYADLRAELAVSRFGNSVPLVSGSATCEPILRRHPLVFRSEHVDRVTLLAWDGSGMML